MALCLNHRPWHTEVNHSGKSSARMRVLRVAPNLRLEQDADFLKNVLQQQKVWLVTLWLGTTSTGTSWEKWDACVMRPWIPWLDFLWVLNPVHTMFIIIILNLVTFLIFTALLRYKWPRKLRRFKAYNVGTLDICIYPGKHHHNQDANHLLSKVSLCPL